MKLVNNAPPEILFETQTGLTVNWEELLLYEAVSTLVTKCHAGSRKWWHDPATGATIQRNVGEMLMLIVSELAEAMEGDRKDKQDDHLPHRKSFEVELADALIRICDIAGGLKVDLPGAFVEKRRYNATRADHTDAARLAPGGKKY